MGEVVQLAAYKGKVVQFEGEIDRFGSYEYGNNCVQTICVKSLRLAKTKQRVNPDHCWFPVRQELAELNLQPGDRILFTTKIHRLNKGFQDMGQILPFKKSPLRITYGPGREVKNVTLLKRRKIVSLPPSSTLPKLQAKLEIAEQENNSLMQAIAALNAQLESYQAQCLEQKTQITELKHQLEQSQQYNVDIALRLQQKLEATTAKKHYLAIIPLCTLLSLGIGFGISMSIHCNSPRYQAGPGQDNPLRHSHTPIDTSTH